VQAIKQEKNIIILITINIKVLSNEKFIIYNEDEFRHFFPKGAIFLLSSHWGASIFQYYHYPSPKYC